MRDEMAIGSDNRKHNTMRSMLLAAIVLSRITALLLVGYTLFRTLSLFLML